MRQKYYLRNEGLLVSLHDPYPWALVQVFAAGELSYHNGVSYLVKDNGAHTADAAHEPGVGANWEDVFLTFGSGPQGIQGIPGGALVWRGLYAGGTAYQANDGVISAEGRGCYALQATTGNAPPSYPTLTNAYWSVFAEKGVIDVHGLTTSAPVATDEFPFYQVATSGNHKGTLADIVALVPPPLGPGVTVGTTADCDYVCDGTADEVPFNAAIAAVAAGTKKGPICIQAGTYTIAAAIHPVNYTRIIGLGEVIIQTASDIDMIDLVQVGTAIGYRVELENFSLSYTGSANYTHYHVLLHSPSSCKLKKIRTYNDACSYSANLKGGIYCVANNNYSWLNIFDNCDLTRLELYRISDSVAKDTQLAATNAGSGAVLGPYAVLIGLACNNMKFERCHFICEKIAAIQVTSAISDLQITNCYFEPAGGSIAGNDEFAIWLAAVVTHSTIIGNHFVGIGGIAIHAPNGIQFCAIANNCFADCNMARNAIYSDVRISGATVTSNFNTITGNTHLNDRGATGAAAAIQEATDVHPPNYNAITGNTASGNGYVATAIIKIGAQSLTTGNIED